MLIQILQKISGYGEQVSSDTEFRRHNRIQNHLLFFGVLIFSGVLIFELIAYFYLMPGTSGFGSHYRAPYIYVDIVWILTIAFIFYIRPFWPAGTLWLLRVSYAILFLRTVSYCVLLGPEANIVLLLPPTMLLISLFEPRRAFAHWFGYFYSAVLLIAVIFWQRDNPAWLPLTPRLTHLLGKFDLYLGTGVTILYTCYLAYRYSWVQRIVKKVLVFANHGVSVRETDDESRWHRSSNLTLILAMVIVAIELLMAIVLSGILFYLQEPIWLKSLTLHFVGASATLYLQFFIFRRANQNALQQRESWLTAFLAVIAAFVIFLIFLTGGDMGVHYFAAVLLFLPVLYFQSIRRIIFTELLLILYVIGAVYMGETVQPYIKIPKSLTQPLTYFVIAGVCLSYLYSIFGFWWRHRLAKKFMILWIKWSNRGTDLFESASEKKYRRISNQVLLIFTTLLLVICAPVEMMIVKYLDGTTAIKFHIWYLLPIIGVAMIQAACVYVHKFVKTVWWQTGAFCAGIALIAYLSISLQESTRIHYFMIALYLLPFIGLSPQRKTDRLLMLSSAFGLILTSLLLQWYVDNKPPLLPVPERWMADLLRYTSLSSLCIVIIVTSYYSVFVGQRVENDLSKEREKSDQLLHNILPAALVTELKKKGRAEPILFHAATVFFTDFVGFTAIAEKLSPEELVSELDKCFSYFDGVCARYGLEKLKTIGDSFMAAGGIPIPNNTHALDCCLAAMEIQAFMRQMKEIKDSLQLPYWELRLGINTGNLVAGVVGEKKFAYDVWGDTVNTASRMESSGTAGKINISQATYEQVRFLFDCEPRGRVKAKNKGEIEMYFLNGLKAKFSVDGSGRVPNAKFKTIYSKIASGAQLVAK